MANDEIVKIDRNDLETIQAALDSARSFCSLFDLQDSMRRLNKQNRASALTLALDRAYNMIEDVLDGDDSVTE